MVASTTTTENWPVLEKAILRVSPPGGWRLRNGERWTVDRNTLRQIADEHARFLKAGYSVPLRLGHKQDGKKIGDVVGLRIDGDVLRADCRITSREYLAECGDKPGDQWHQDVSVGVAEYEDGAGNVYTNLLDHVAVTDSPTVGGLGPFRHLDKSFPTLTRLIQMAADTPEVPKKSAVSTVGMLNVVLAERFGDGVKLAGDDESDMVSVADVMDLLNAMRDGESGEEEETTEAPPAEVPIPAAEGETITLAKHREELRSIYVEAVEDLKASNAITPAMGKDMLTEADKSGRYSFGEIKRIRQLSKGAVNTGRVVQGVDPSAPKVGAADPEQAKKTTNRLLAGMGLKHTN